MIILKSKGGGMKKLIIVGFTLMLVSCASYSQMFVNNEGKIQRCSSTGGGLIGIAAATSMQRNCMSDMKDLGYIEYEKAGALGVLLKDHQFEDRMPVVLKVLSGMGADKAGIKANDKIIAVNNLECKTIKECKTLLFGEAGQSVKVTVLREGDKKDFTVILEPMVNVLEAMKNK